MVSFSEELFERNIYPNASSPAQAMNRFMNNLRTDILQEMRAGASSPISSTGGSLPGNANAAAATATGVSLPGNTNAAAEERQLAVEAAVPGNAANSPVTPSPIPQTQTPLQHLNSQYSSDSTWLLNTRVLTPRSCHKSARKCCQDCYLRFKSGSAVLSRSTI